MSDPPAREPFPSPRPIPALDVEALEKLRVRLERYAARIIEQAAFHSPLGRPLPEDLAADAIMHAVANLSGQPTERVWDQERYGMPAFCFGVVKSLVSAAKTHCDQRRGVDVEGEIEKLTVFNEGEDAFEMVALREMHDQLIASLGADRVALKVLNLMLYDDRNSTLQIAQTLGLHELEVTRARQRIFRHGRKIASRDQ